MHIVGELRVTSGEEAATRRRVWEAAVETRLLRLEASFEVDMARLRAHEAKADTVREACAAQLAEVIENLAPLADPRSGEANAALAAVLVRAVRELGALYAVQRAPRVPVIPPLPPEPAAVSVEEVGRVPVAARRAEVLGQLVTARERLQIGG